MSPTNAPDSREPSLQVDCLGRPARDIVREAVPYCLRARSSGVTPAIEILHLEGLNDSISRLLKAFDRLAAEYGARIRIADPSGFGEAFLGALADEGHLDLVGGRAK